MYRKLDAFQMRGIRKILKLETTFINRANLHANVLKRATQIAYPKPEDTRKIQRFSDFHKDRKAKLLGHILRTDNEDPLRQISFQNTSAYRVEYGKERVGKPRQNWIHQTKKYDYVAKCCMFSYTESKQQDSQLLKYAREHCF